jgi:hypothetical protein
VKIRPDPFSSYWKRIAFLSTRFGYKDVSPEKLIAKILAFKGKKGPRAPIQKHV